MADSPCSPDCSRKIRVPSRRRCASAPEAARRRVKACGATQLRRGFARGTRPSSRSGRDHRDCKEDDSAAVVTNALNQPKIEHAPRTRPPESGPRRRKCSTTTSSVALRRGDTRARRLVVSGPYSLEGSATRSCSGRPTRTNYATKPACTENGGMQRPSTVDRRARAAVVDDGRRVPALVNGPERAGRCRTLNRDEVAVVGIMLIVDRKARDRYRLPVRSYAWNRRGSPWRLR